MVEFYTGAGLAIADLVSLFLIFIVWPIAGELGRLSKNPDGDAPAINPMDVYNTSMISLWVTAVFVLAGWALTGRSWDKLGFAFS